MGYYSDVGLALTKEAVQILKQKLTDKAIPAKLRENVDYLFNNANIHLCDANNGAECWKWESIKWYEYDPEWYPEIDWLTKALSDLDEEDFYFIRFGEDYEDNEIRGLFWDNPFCLQFSRGISVEV